MKLLVMMVLICLGSSAWAGWGSIAWSPSSGQVGWSAGYDCLGDAENEALAQCGNGDCQIMNWEHDLCNAFATAGDRWGEAHGYSDSQTAIDSALNACGADCTWRAWICN